MSDSRPAQEGSFREALPVAALVMLRWWNGRVFCISLEIDGRFSFDAVRLKDTTALFGSSKGPTTTRYSRGLNRALCMHHYSGEALCDFGCAP